MSHGVSNSRVFGLRELRARFELYLRSVDLAQEIPILALVSSPTDIFWQLNCGAVKNEDSNTKCQKLELN